MSREVTSEQSLVCEGAGYDEVFASGHEPEEGFSWSSKWETLVQSSDEEVESGGGEDEVVSEGEDEDDEGERGRESDGDENDGEEEVLESTLGSPGDDHPFILPKKWTVNDFLPTMSDKFSTLYVTITKFRTTSQSVYFGSLRSAIQGRQRISACIMPCSQQD